MGLIGRALPGELEGKLDPEDYGFGVIREQPLTEEDRVNIIGHFYAQVKDVTGIVIPKLEPYLSAVSNE